MPHRGTSIWRYLESKRFLELINTSVLYVPNVRNLGPLEGSYSEPSVAHTTEALDEAHAVLREIGIDNQPQLRKDLMQNCFFVSCWHMSEYETELMWKYTYKDPGCAIQTTVPKLLALELPKCPDRSVSITAKFGKVIYTDFSIPGTVPGTDNCLFFKDYFYRGDDEFRFVININNQKPALLEAGIRLRFGADFVERIVLNPDSEGGFVSEVKRIAAEKNIPVEESRGKNSPFWGIPPKGRSIN
jgi:hypothetical protein